MTLLRQALADLETVEELLDVFAIPYDQRVVDRSRLHILQRAHDYLAGEAADLSDAALSTRFANVLAQAYADFERSDAQTEKVFAVFKRPPPLTAEGARAFVPIEAIVGRPTRVG